MGLGILPDAQTQIKRKGLFLYACIHKRAVCVKNDDRSGSSWEWGAGENKRYSRRQDISGKYLEQIISILSRAGCVRSVRGNQGGYYLTRPASEYTVGMILRITEGNLAPVDCLAGEDNPCQRRDDCVTLRLWQELDDAIRGVVDQYTIEDLARWQEAAK